MYGFFPPYAPIVHDQTTVVYWGGIPVETIDGRPFCKQFPESRCCSYETCDPDRCLLRARVAS